MTTILVYRLNADGTLRIKGRWEDGEWVYDKAGFSDIDNMDEYTERLLLDRFDGPVLFAAREEEISSNGGDLQATFNINARRGESLVTSDFVTGKIRMVERYKDGELDEDDYTEEEWERLERWVKEYG